jgi:cytochrome b561
MAGTSYSLRARRLHWSMAALVLVAYVTSNLVPTVAHGSPERCFVIRTHFMAGWRC